MFLSGELDVDSDEVFPYGRPRVYILRVLGIT